MDVGMFSSTPATVTLKLEANTCITLLVRGTNARVWPREGFHRFPPKIKRRIPAQRHRTAENGPEHFSTFRIWHRATITIMDD